MERNYILRNLGLQNTTRGVIVDVVVIHPRGCLWKAVIITIIARHKLYGSPSEKYEDDVHQPCVLR